MRGKTRDLLVFLALILIVNVIMPVITLDLPLLLGLACTPALIFHIILISIILIGSCIVYIVFNYRTRSYLYRIVSTFVLMIIGLTRILVDPMITYSFSTNSLYITINNHMVALLDVLLILSFYTGYILLDVTRIIEKRSLKTTYRRRGVINHYMREN